MVTTSAIIPTKNRPVDLKSCIKSLVGQTIVPDEIVIVDASDPAVFKANRRNCENIVGEKARLIYINSEPGVNHQRNKGADNASGEIIFFFDDDVILNKNYIEKILDVYKLKNCPETGGVQGCISNYYSSSWLNRTFKRFFFMTRASVNEKSRFLPSLGYVYILSPPGIIEVEAMPAGLCSYYKKKFEEFRFDESFDRCTDLELNYRVSRRYKLYQTPYAQLVHNHSESTHVNDRELNRRMFINSYNLVRKHQPLQTLNRIAYFWSVVGEVILNAVKSIVKLDPSPLLGTFEGIYFVIKEKYSKKWRLTDDR